MNKRIQYITFIITVLFIYSCGKNKDPLFDGVNCTGKCFILTGKLLDSAANAPISSAEIKFYFQDTRGGIFKQKYYLGKAITDRIGNYSFRFDGTTLDDSYGYYVAEAYKGNLFHDPFYGNRVSTFYLDSSLHNIPFVQNFSLFRPATLNLRIFAPANLNVKSLTVDCSYARLKRGIVINGGRAIDTVLTFKTAGDIRTFINARMIGNGTNITKMDTVLVPSYKTRQIEIRF